MISRSIAPAIANSFFLLLLPRIKYEENTTIAARQKNRQKEKRKKKKSVKTRGNDASCQAIAFIELRPDTSRRFSFAIRDRDSKGRRADTMATRDRGIVFHRHTHTHRRATRVREKSRRGGTARCLECSSIVVEDEFRDATSDRFAVVTIVKLLV